MVFLATIAIGCMFVIPRFAHGPREGLAAVRGCDPQHLGHPHHAAQLALVLGGSVAAQLLYASASAAASRAYGGSLSFIELVFVNTSASFLASLTPVPGGMGIQEAALIAGLTAFGFQPEIAAAAVITHRLFTTYLPPIWGSCATKRLIADGYLQPTRYRSWCPHPRCFSIRREAGFVDAR